MSKDPGEGDYTIPGPGEQDASEILQRKLRPGMYAEAPKLQIGDFVRDNDGRYNESDAFQRILEVIDIVDLPKRGRRKVSQLETIEHAVLKQPGYTGKREHVIALHRIYIDGKQRRSGWSLSDRHGVRIYRYPGS